MWSCCSWNDEVVIQHVEPAYIPPALPSNVGQIISETTSPLVDVVANDEEVVVYSSSLGDGKGSPEPVAAVVAVDSTVETPVSAVSEPEPAPVAAAAVDSTVETPVSAVSEPEPAPAAAAVDSSLLGTDMAVSGECVESVVVLPVSDIITVIATVEPMCSLATATATISRSSSSTPIPCLDTNLDAHVPDDLCPPWVLAGETSQCFECDAPFSAGVSRHCRRCRNLFCEACTPKITSIALYNITERVCVCTKCYSELLMENNWILNHRPLLLGGGKFLHAFPLGLGLRPVELVLQDDLKTLAFQQTDEGEGCGKTTRLPLLGVEQVSTPGPDKFTLHVGKKTYQFDCSNTITNSGSDRDTEVQGRWVKALKSAVMRSHQRQRNSGFKETVMKERANRRLRWAKERERAAAAGGVNEAEQ